MNILSSQIENLFITINIKRLTFKGEFVMQNTLNKNGFSATVDTLGGELISFKTPSNTEVIWNGDKNFWSGHAPVLFPVVGALINNEIEIEGKTFQIRKHGFARKTEFKLESLTNESATFTLETNSDTLACYPFRFKLSVTHTINENGYSTEYKVTNKDVRSMPFSIGGHAGFMCPFEKSEKFEDYDLIFDKSGTCDAYYTDSDSIIHNDYKKSVFTSSNTIPLNYDDFDNDVLILKALNSKSVTLKNRKTNKGVNFTFYGLNNLGIWTTPLKKAPFIALEPWKGLPAFQDETGKFTDKPDIAILKPGESYSAGYTVELLNL